MNGDPEMNDFSAVEAGQKSPDVLDNVILQFLRTHKTVWPQMVPYLKGSPVTCGSRLFDQAIAVDILLRTDAKDNDGQIGKFEKSHVDIWKRLPRILRRSGFDMKGGRLTGLLEHRPKANEKDEPSNEDEE